MASRRKSTTPCMVPPQRQHHHPVDSDPDMEVVAEGDEEEDGGGDSSARLSPPASDERPPASSDHYVKTAADCGGGSEGGYECKYCSFRTAALNLFTLHVDGEHPDVVLNSAYVCVACDFRTRRYDALQEHNARHHPGEDGFTRTMVRRQNHTVFEQTVNDLTFAGGFVKMEDGEEEEEEETKMAAVASCKGIAFSKTPIMKIKSRAEAKKFPSAAKMATVDVIKVESDGELEDSEEEADLGGSGSAPPPPIAPAPALVTVPAPHAIQTLPQGIVLNSSNLLQFKTGAGSTTTAMLPPGTLAQVLSALQNQQNLQQNQNQQSHTHQLLIPLSSIPTYSAAMDSNVLLVGAYNRFPYPSVPEIAALAAQTKFGEEQIRVWFSAQRLKRGVSWTPEEVDEARRKKFNGAVVQPGVGGQTITVIPASSLAAAAAANGLQSIFQTCQIVGQPGLVLTQVGGGGGGGGGSPLTLTVAGVTGGHQQAKAAKSEPPAAAAATAAEPGATHSPDPQGTKPKKSKEQLAELKASYTRRQFATEAEISRLMRVTNLTKRAIKKWFSDTRYNQRSARDHDQRARDLLLAGGPLGGGVADGNGGLLLLDDLDAPGGLSAAGPNATIVIDSSDDAAGEFSPLSVSAAARHETTPPSAAGAGGTPRTPPTPSSSSSSSDPRVKFRNAFPDFTPQRFKEKTAEQLTALDASFLRSATPSDDELTRLRSTTKLTRREVDAWFTERRKSLDAAEAADGAEGGPTPPPSAAAAAGGRKVTKKTPEQLHALKSAFVRSQWPAADEYDKMADDTGLPRNYIVNWFGDTRYAAKNSTLKWFYQYQGGGGLAAPDQNGGGGGGKHKKPRKRFRGWSRRTRRPCPPCKRPHPPAAAAASAARPPALAAGATAGGRRFLREHYLRHGALGEKDLDELVSKSSMSYEQVRAWFSGVVSRVERGLPPFEGEEGGEEQAEVQGVEARPPNRADSEGEMEVKEQGEEDGGSEEEEERHEEEEEDEEGRRDDEEDRRGDEGEEAEEGGEHREEQPRAASQPEEEEQQP